MDIDLELYKVFYFVATTGNITASSDKLHISQPAITKHIKNLEDQLGISLFIRTKRGVILTEAGEKVFEQAKNIIINAKNIDSIAKAFANFETGTVKIGTGKSLAKTFIVPILKEMKAKYPGIKIEFEIRPTEYLIKKLRKGEVDFVFSKFPKKYDETLDYEKIGELHDCFICNKDYPELLNAPIPIKELSKYRLLLPQGISMSRKLLDTLSKNNDFEMEADMEMGSLSLLAKFVEEGYGIGIETKEYIKDLLEQKLLYEIKTVPCLDKIDYGIITLPSTILSPADKKFIECIKQK